MAKTLSKKQIKTLQHILDIPFGKIECLLKATAVLVLAIAAAGDNPITIRLAVEAFLRELRACGL